MPFFICPNCKERSIDHDGRHGLLQPAVACERCGFGFLFELIDDYYPGPNTGFLVCDQQARILAVGRGIFELTGFRDAVLMGRRLEDALDFSRFDPGRDQAHLALEWGVRRLDEQVAVRTRAGQQKAVKGDFFPAYDEDGGLLVALTPR